MVFPVLPQLRPVSHIMQTDQGNLRGCKSKHFGGKMS